MEKLKQITLAIFGTILILSVSGYGLNHYINKRVSEATSRLEQSYELKAKDKQKEVDKAADALRKEVDKQTKDKDAKIKTLNSRIATLTRELQNRPSRSNGPDGTPGSGQACTGLQLSREDSEFLIGEATRAEEVLIERDYYYNAYEEARKKVNQLNGTQTPK